MPKRKSAQIPIAPEAIRRARGALGETQAQFAHRVGSDQATVSRWENGRLPKRGSALLLLRRVLAEINSVYHP
jgi:DNA-binding transcriptional regulator YiaG